MAVALRGQRVLQDAVGATTITVNLPAGATSDMLAVLVCMAGNVGVASAPTGWSVAPKGPAQCRSDAGGVTGASVLVQVDVFYRVLTGGETSVSVGYAAPSPGVFGVFLFSGVDTDLPFDAAAVDPTNPTTTTIAGVGSAFSVDGALLLACYATDGSGAITPAAGMTSLFSGSEGGGANTLCVAMEAMTLSPRVNVAKDATTSGSTGSVAFFLTIAPAAEVAAGVLADARDLYGSLALFQKMDPKFSRQRTSVLAKVLAPIGEADNDIIGLFGADNFLDSSASAYSAQALVRRVTSATASRAAADPGTTVSVTVPSLVRDGDFLVAHVLRSNSTDHVTPTASGWAAAAAGVNATDGSSVRYSSVILTKVAAGEPATWAFTVGTAANAIVIVAVYRNVDVAAVLPQTWSSYVSGTASLVYNTPQITVPSPRANTVLLVFSNGSFANAVQPPRGEELVAVQTQGALQARTFEEVIAAGSGYGNRAPHLDLLVVASPTNNEACQLVSSLLLPPLLF